MNDEKRKKLKVFATVPIPEHLLKPLLNQSDRFEFRMTQNVNTSLDEVLGELKDCDALIVTPFVPINKKVLDLIGNNLKVPYFVRLLIFIYIKTFDF